MIQDKTSATRSGAGARIMVMAGSPQRVMTMLPVVRALVAAGYAARLCYPLHLASRLVADGVLDGIDHEAVDRHRLAERADVDVFIGPESAMASAPRRAIRIAIFHSLPDDDLTIDHRLLFRGRPDVTALADYFCIAVRQTPAQWRVAHYRKIVDRVYPRALLADRRAALTLVPLGYPKIDLLMTRAGDATPRDTITYAPTQSVLPYSSVRAAGAEIIATLLKRFPEQRIAFRPYPGHDPGRLADIAARFADAPRFHFDTSLTGDDLMMRSAVVVTDRSSMAMSYSLGLGRPAVFFNQDGIKGDDPKGVSRFDPVGFRAGSVAAVARAVARALRESEAIADRIADTRGDHIYNPGAAADYLARVMPDILAGRSRADWLALPRRPFLSRDPKRIAAHLETVLGRIGKAKNRKRARDLLAPGFAAQAHPWLGRLERIPGARWGRRALLRLLRRG